MMLGQPSIILYFCPGLWRDPYLGSAKLGTRRKERRLLESYFHPVRVFAMAICCGFLGLPSLSSTSFFASRAN